MSRTYSDSEMQAALLLRQRPHRKMWASVFFLTLLVGGLVPGTAITVFVYALLSADLATAAQAFAVGVASGAAMIWVLGKTGTRF